MNQNNELRQGNMGMNKLLIIDDDRMNRKILGKIFSDRFLIMEAEDGQMGITKILDEGEDLSAVFLDVVMPGMSGIEVLHYLNKIGFTEKVPVFLITAEREEHMVKEAYELGVMDVIVKPVIPYLVQRRVHSIVELFEARRHLNNVVDAQNVELLEQAEKIIYLNQGMIEALATAIEFRSQESGGHVKRISDITKIMMKNTEFGEGLSETQIDDIATAAIMHDVGKISIPDAILTKPGRLTPEEYEIMKTHTTKGVTLLESITQLQESGVYQYACDIAHHHHERWDGRGYPEGLKGDEISPWAQVVSLADVYDALSCKRVYKAAFSREKVTEMIWTGQSGVFNPRLLECFFSVEDQILGMYQGVLT